MYINKDSERFEKKLSKLRHNVLKAIMQKNVIDGIKFPKLLKRERKRHTANMRVNRQVSRRRRGGGARGVAAAICDLIYPSCKGFDQV